MRIYAERGVSVCLDGIGERYYSWTKRPINCVEHFAIILPKDAPADFYSLGIRKEKWQERLEMPDITQVIMTFSDGRKKEFQVNWDNKFSRTQNRYQEMRVVGPDIVITISPTKHEWSDF
jgi:hypothetical protein